MHRNSSSRFALMLVLGLACATVAHADRPVPGIPYITNAATTRSDAGDVTLHLRGFFPDTTCWTIGPGSGSLSLNMVHLLGEDCPDTLTSDIWQWHFDLGQMMPGHYRLLLTMNVVEGVTSTLYQGVFEFDIPLPPMPYVEEIRIEPAGAGVPGRPIAPGDSIRVTVRGHFPNACYSLTKFELAPVRSRIFPAPIDMTVERGNCLDCPEVLTPFEASLVQPPLAAGFYQQILRMTETDCALPDSIVAKHQTSAPFSVVGDTVKYLSRIIVSPAHGVPGDSICAQDSIRIRFEGEFPNTCGSFERIEVAESYPPAFAVWLDLTNCQQACGLAIVPWSAEVVIAPLYAGQYALPVQVIATACTDDNVVSRQRTYAQFDVRECSPGPGCFMPGFAGNGECDAVIGPDRRSQLDFTLSTNTPLAGLQGTFVLEPPGLEITGLEPIGGAAGMRLAWRTTPNGARFTLFSDDGSTLDPCIDTGRCDGRILRISLAAGANAPARVTYLRPEELLGSDPNGQAVYGCPTMMRFAPIMARICTQPGCDTNHDGHADIRDLVLMVQCLMLRDDRSMIIPCPFFDCNGDSIQSIDDVLCCARRILIGNPCFDCPPDTTPPRPTPVQVSMGTPVVSQDRVVVPVRLGYAEHLGGARLELAFPSDRYEVEDMSLAGGKPNWLSLHEVRGNRVVAGIVRIGPEVTLDTNQQLELLLTLRLKPGQTPGGDVRSAGGEFSGNDGKLLQVPFALVQPLTGPAKLALSEARPNPFGDETVFAITLDQPADVTVGIYDLSGRLVATPQSGPLTAGSHPIVWNGRDGDGSALPNGVYFALAQSGEARASRKLVLLKGN